MKNRSEKIFDVTKPDAEVPIKATRRLELVCAEERSQEGVPQDRRQMWKELFLEAIFFQALLESDKEKLTEMLRAAERVMVLRAQELSNSSGQHEELGEMDRALAALLSIKTQKLGWPAVSAGDGLS